MDHRDPDGPETLDAALLAAEALGAAGNNGGAVLVLRRLLGRCPDHARAHYLLGANLLGAGRHRDAVEACRTALRLSPEDAVAHRVTGVVLGTGRTVRREALGHLRRAVDLAPGDGLSHFYLARHHAARRQVKRARAGYARACALSPGEPMILAGAAEYLFALGRHRDGIRLAAAALAAGPHHPLALAAQARACLIQGRPAEAGVLARASIALVPTYKPAVAIAVESAMGRNPLFAAYFRLRNWCRRGWLHRVALVGGYVVLASTVLPNSGLPLPVWAALDWILFWGAFVAAILMGWLYRRRLRDVLRPVSLQRRF